MIANEKHSSLFTLNVGDDDDDDKTFY